ncbi:hypothetical protein MJI20_28865, partial [Salmonella enterica subsp. enterica serovar Anatum]|nr:hypothetical protein [Salmonella enterica subsp. enterica serovar Anatum]
ADALFALGIGIYILYSALRMGYEAVQSLLDRALPDAERQEIIAPQRKLSPRASAFPSQQLIFCPAPMSTGEHVGQQAGCDDDRGR